MGMVIYFLYLVMNKLCLYWAPGTFGDLVVSFLITQQYLTAMTAPYINSQGRVCFDYDKQWSDLFRLDPTSHNHDYWREWSVDQLAVLNNLDKFVICTHNLDQCTQIKEYFNSQITTIGITYTEDFYDLILSTVIKKVLADDSDVLSILETNQPQLVKLYKETDKWEEFLYKVFSKNKSHIIPSHVTADSFDLSIPMTKLIAGDLAFIETVLNFKLSPNDVEFFNRWYSRQNFNITNI